MPNNFYIKNQDHFKLYVKLKDKNIFEVLLLSDNINFHVDENQILTSSDTRYFLLIEDKEKIDKILIGNGIVASTDIVNVSDYRDQKKAQMIYLCFLIAMILIFMAIMYF